MARKLKHYDTIIAPGDHREVDAGLGARQGRVPALRRRRTKPEIKAAVEALFNVKVTAREHADPQGQDQALPRHRAASRADVKKAIVTLAEGQSIDVTTGL